MRLKFTFFTKGCLPFHAFSLNERPLGGTETAVIHLANTLHRMGHQVVVFTAHDNPPPSEPLYLPFRSANLIGKLDVLICVREWQALFANIEAKKKFLWTGDSYDQFPNVGIGDHRVAKKIDALLTVSNWHSKTLCAYSGFPINKTWVLGNGVDLSLFQGKEQRRRKRLIYSSTPYRGLQLLPAIYAPLKEKHPELELHIFSGYDVYSSPEPYLKSALDSFEKISEQLKLLPGCVMHGNVLQANLAREYMKSSILAYPNIFEETCCITAMEAQAAGCAIVTSNLGALKETVGEAGILIDKKPGTQEYIQEFYDAVDQILCNDQLLLGLSEAGKKRAHENFDWNITAQKFLNYLEEHHQ